jgi:hypothetical protein
MFRATADQIAASGLSHRLQEVLWLVPASQSTHIVALSVLFASAMQINLRLLGVGIGGRTVSQLARTLVPWMWRALIVLLFTGALQTFIEPVRQFVTPIFWGKMVLVVLLALLTRWVARTLRDNAAQWDDATTRPAVARVFAVVSTLGWVTVIAFGRFIGYVWEKYA